MGRPLLVGCRCLKGIEGEKVGGCSLLQGSVLEEFLFYHLNEGKMWC